MGPNTVKKNIQKTQNIFPKSIKKGKKREDKNVYKHFYNKQKTRHVFSAIPSSLSDKISLVTLIQKICEIFVIYKRNLEMIES